MVCYRVELYKNMAGASPGTLTYGYCHNCQFCDVCIYFQLHFQCLKRGPPSALVSLPKGPFNNVEKKMHVMDDEKSPISKILFIFHKTLNLELWSHLPRKQIQYDFNSANHADIPLMLADSTTIFLVCCVSMFLELYLYFLTVNVIYEKFLIILYLSDL